MQTLREVETGNFSARVIKKNKNKKGIKSEEQQF